MARAPAWARVLAAAWLGLLATIAFVAAPAAFATLARADAGRYVARVFSVEAWSSLAIALVLLLAEQQAARRAAAQGRGSVMSGATLLLLGTLFCTVAGHFGIEPMMAAARSGTGPWPFGALHAASTVLYGAKALLVLAVAWRWQRPGDCAPLSPPAS
jgi:hypothetical protein